MRKLLPLVLLLWLLGAAGAGAGAAGPEAQAGEPGLSYTAQADDWLPHLADKFYRDRQVWPAIWLATQARATTDSRFLPFDSPYFLPPGQPLLIPPPAEADQLAADYWAAGHEPWPPPDLQPLGPAWLADFRAYVSETRRHFRIPGAAVAVLRGDQIVLAQGLGVRELGRPEPVTPDTIFAIGSTTKSMTTMLVASLVDEGRLDWDQPVQQLWPDFALADPAVARQLRLRDMFSMSSGMPRADLVWSGANLSPEQVMASLAELPLTAPPGQRFQYSNQMVATGGYLAALTAGGRYGQLGPAYADLLQRRIFEPIGMRSATLSLEVAQAHSNHATPHDFSLTDQTRPTEFHTDPGIAPAGGAYANVLDLARLVLTQLNRGLAPDGRRVVSAQNLTETWQPHIEAYGQTQYGLGWFIESYQGLELIWHDGDVLGFKSLLVFIPEADVGLVLLTNRTISIGFSSSVRYRLVESLYGLEEEAGQFYKEQWQRFEESLPQLRAPLQTTVPLSQVVGYLGPYSDGWQVERRADGTVWAVRGPYHWQLLAAGPGKFVVNNGFGITTPLQFIEADNGSVTMTFELSTGEKGTYRRLKPANSEAE